MPKDDPSGIKTMAIRLSPETHAQLSLIAQLEDTSIAELLRQAIAEFIERKREGGALAERANAILADIDRETAERKAAIQAMLDNPADAKPAGVTPITTGGRRRKAGPDQAP